ncbi:helix-turn-helix transcriptional regulator [Asticcacaulis taihuensis]|jgi:putative transcriptional regulator|uniref:Putative transcriptional regulator n=1 Tax=Asticcacaulis taihuensis TaxID=260084 RepID=A0A1G4RWV2_9CAUL|nr:helix-turn-helix transcriptional regulator [Asticcacaulis taihuensis]SCW60559.1 putative transcriptional regulator [Asticcacaulis taihuensis]
MKQNLRELRTEKGLTQADLANQLGVSRQAVIALETDKHSPSLDLAYKISAVFDLPVEAIFQNPYR